MHAHISHSASQRHDLGVSGALCIMHRLSSFWVWRAHAHCEKCKPEASLARFGTFFVAVGPMNTAQGASLRRGVGLARAPWQQAAPETRSP